MVESNIKSVSVGFYFAAQHEFVQMKPLVELQSLRGDITTSLLKQQHVVININESSVSLCVFDSVEPTSCWVQLFRVSFSKRLHSKPSSAMNRLLNTEWFQAGTLSFKLTSFILYSDSSIAVCQISAVLLWPQLWSPTAPIWESWTWVTMICWIQEWRFSLLDWRVQIADWRLWGQFMCFSIYKMKYIFKLI